MLYKIYNEPSGVGTAAKTIKSVIYYNVYNVMEWGNIQTIQDHTRPSRPYKTIRDRTRPYETIRDHTSAKKRAANNLQPVNPRTIKTF